MPFNFFIFLLISCSLMADPWGKDADLSVFSKAAQPETAHSDLGVKLSELLIRFHQDVISPADGPRSHFIPSSSQYTMEAIRKYGFFKGWIYGCDRLMRENSEKWVYREVLSPSGTMIKWDPVR